MRLSNPRCSRQTNFDGPELEGVRPGSRQAPRQTRRPLCFRRFHWFPPIATRCAALQKHWPNKPPRIRQDALTPLLRSAHAAAGGEPHFRVAEATTRRTMAEENSCMTRTHVNRQTARDRITSVSRFVGCPVQAGPVVGDGLCEQGRGAEDRDCDSLDVVCWNAGQPHVWRVPRHRRKPPCAEMLSAEFPADAY